MASGPTLLGSWDWDPRKLGPHRSHGLHHSFLHGRLGGWWGGYGLAVGSIASFLTILMAWYGVNFVLAKASTATALATGANFMSPFLAH